jgi:hypothetical protein
MMEDAEEELNLVLLTNILSVELRLNRVLQPYNLQT